MMTSSELEARWQSISHVGVKSYRSLLLSSDCIPDLYIGKDVSGNRFLILQVPASFALSDATTNLQYLSLQTDNNGRRIAIGLLNPRFSDLFNDLILSLYHKVKEMYRPEDYTSAFTDSFYRWAEFFEDATSGLLSKEDVQGLFGELIVLRYFLQQRTFSVDNLLTAWQGPYGRAQDFIFPANNLEVKTRDASQAIVRISSEHQLQPETGKGLQLAIATVQEHSKGLTIDALCNEVRSLIPPVGQEIALFLKTLLRAGVAITACANYDRYKWKPQFLTFYECSDNDTFPKIITAQIREGISGVKYHLAVSSIAPFITQTHTL